MLGYSCVCVYAPAGSLHHTSNSTSNQADKAKLLHHKTVIHFNTVDR